VPAVEICHDSIDKPFLSKLVRMAPKTLEMPERCLKEPALLRETGYPSRALADEYLKDLISVMVLLFQETMETRKSRD
jgi:hypothetical protein